MQVCVCTIPCLRLITASWKVLVRVSCNGDGDVDVDMDMDGVKRGQERGAMGKGGR